jgi:hypothetical protein
MLSTNEADIKPPAFPLTVAINGAVTDFYFDYFMKKHFPPGYAFIITSGHRTKEKNKEVGGAANSAHMHNLARDFVVTKDGKALNQTEYQNFYKNYIQDSWNGYSYTSGKHIHVNLSRKIGIAANLLAFSVFGILGVNMFSKLTKRKKS